MSVMASCSPVQREWTSVSRWFAGRTREGYRPHARHWQGLAQLVGAPQLETIRMMHARIPSTSNCSEKSRLTDQIVPDGDIEVAYVIGRDNEDYSCSFVNARELWQHGSSQKAGKLLGFRRTPLQNQFVEFIEKHNDLFRLLEHSEDMMTTSGWLPIIFPHSKIVFNRRLHSILLRLTSHGAVQNSAWRLPRRWSQFCGALLGSRAVL
jgi:hypothetical protein